MDEQSDGADMLYGAAAVAYRDAGWLSVLPLPRGVKWPPPQKYTGYDGKVPSFPDIYAWCEQCPDGNLALRLSENVIGIDVDAYDGRTGGATFAHAIAQWGPLPDTVRSTSRDDNVSGIRLFRVPPGTHLVTKLGFPEHGIGHVEIIQYFHRYVMAWPSVHPNGSTYRWLDEQGFVLDEIPALADLPDLPARWLAGLAAAPTTGDHLGQVDVRAALADMPAGAIDLRVSDRLNRAILDLTGVDSRHDATLGHVLALLRLAEQGHTGVPDALAILGQAFVAAVTATGEVDGRTSTEATLEYDRMVRGNRGHALIAETPTVDLEELAGLTPGVRARNRVAPAVPTTTTPVPGSVVGAADATPPEPSPPPELEPVSDPEAPHAPFWDERPSLQRIRQYAYARMCSPWAVLGVVMCRALTTVPPWIALPPIIGGRGSLNLFVALVGVSGTGKGAAEAVGLELLPVEVHVAPAGTGEGLAHQFVHMEKRELIRDRHSVMFSIPEIDTLLEIGNRTGSTILSKLRSAFSGEEIGFSYADPTKRLLVGAHNYRLCMIVGIQPSKAGPLLNDSGGGTPQRFVYLPSTDPKISLERPTTPDPLDIPELSSWGCYPRTVTIPAAAEELILTEHVKRARGDGTALDGHALFVREKVAFALALLDGRNDMNDDDWILAGTVMVRSDLTRAEIADTLQAVTDSDIDEQGRTQGRSRVAAEDTVMETRIRKIGLRLVANLDKHGPETYAAAARRIWAKHREYFEDALRVQIAAGNVFVDDGLLRRPEAPE